MIQVHSDTSNKYLTTCTYKHSINMVRVSECYIWLMYATFDNSLHSLSSTFTPVLYSASLCEYLHKYLFVLKFDTVNFYYILSKSMVHRKLAMEKSQYEPVRLKQDLTLIQRAGAHFIKIL